MKKQLLFVAALIVFICSCDPGKEKVTQKKESEVNDSPISGPGVGHDVGTRERSRENTDYPNRRKHSFLHPYIPSIRANIDSVKFFEGPYSPPEKEQRQYRTGFDRRKTRYINWELNLTHKPPGQTVYFRIDSEWYKNAKLFYRYSMNATIEADWEYSYQSHSYNMGQWSRGIYRVDLSIGGQKVASEYFDVYNADCSGDLTLHGTDTVDGLRRQADSYRSSRNSSQYQDALLRLGIALHNRAGQCFLNGHLDASLQDFSEAIQIHPNFHLAYYHRALVLLDLKRPKEALADLEAAIRDKKIDDYYAARAQAQFHLENDPEALADLNRAIELNSKRPDFYHDRGIVWYYLGEDQSALRDLKQTATMYQSRNEQEKYQKVAADIDILEGRTQGNLILYGTGRRFTLAELKD